MARKSRKTLEEELAAARALAEQETRARERAEKELADRRDAFAAAKHFNLIFDQIKEERDKFEQKADVLQTLVDSLRGDKFAEYRAHVLTFVDFLSFFQPDTRNHVVFVGMMAYELALELGISEDEAEDLALDTTLHDLGKLKTPKEILFKPGPLDPDERIEMQKHTDWGDKMLAQLGPRYERSRQIARWHHENWDGTGYPDGLRGEQIPLDARIVHVADVIHALGDKSRTYKEAWSDGRIRFHIIQNSGKMFDPELTKPTNRILSGGGFGDVVPVCLKELGLILPHHKKV